ncbi:uncharacterized protein [Montipora capricornis]|uniref:uncharacterized protein n=1 Tax=Montipora capricornis TaxID=246305 RepID=UPI0035F15EA9
MEEFHSWFDETKLTPYKQMFLDNGYDDLEVLASITDGELREIGVHLPGHRKKILLKVSCLRKKMKLDEDGEDAKHVPSDKYKGAGQNSLDDDVSQPGSVSSVSSPSGSGIDSLRAKKRKQSPFAKWVKGPSKELPMYQKAAERKVKLFSCKEIADAQGLEKIRRFWNEKAEELCQDTALKKWKATAIHGVVDTAWTLKKTVILVVEANNTREQELREVKDSSQIKRQKAETVEAKGQRTLSSHRELLRVNERLRRLNDRSNTTSEKKKKVAEEEIAAKTALGELKLAQESLRKALQNKRKCLAAPTPFQGVPSDVVEDCKEPTTEDIDGMLETVLKRTRPSRDEDEDEDEEEEEEI